MLVEYGLGIDETQDIARGRRRRFVMAAKDDACQLPRAERNHHATAWLDAVLQRQRKRVSERLLQRNGKTDVTEEMRHGSETRVVSHCEHFIEHGRKVRALCSRNGGIEPFEELHAIDHLLVAGLLVFRVEPVKQLGRAFV